MDTSRRALLKTVGIGASALVTSGEQIGASSQRAAIPSADMGSASDKEGELAIVNFDLLEEAAKRIRCEQISAHPSERSALWMSADPGWWR